MRDTPVARELLQAIAEIRLPPFVDQRLQTLMDRNTNGILTVEERSELEALVEWSEQVAPLKAHARFLLGWNPT